MLGDMFSQMKGPDDIVRVSGKIAKTKEFKLSDLVKISVENFECNFAPGAHSEICTKFFNVSKDGIIANAYLSEMLNKEEYFERGHEYGELINGLSAKEFDSHFKKDKSLKELGKKDIAEKVPAKYKLTFYKIPDKFIIKK